MSPIMTSAHKAAAALRRAETALRNWQDEPDSPRKDVDEMLRLIAGMRALVQGHLLEQLHHHEERASRVRSSGSSATARADETVVAEEPESYDHQARDEE